MNVQNPWNDYSSYIRKIFGSRVQKIAVDAGFSCPNRDGSIATGGCIYCSNQSFSPYYCNNDNSNIKEQLQQGINFFSPKYKTQKYLAYFQTYTNTYADTETCLRKYSEALNVNGVIGLIIATRPDAVDKVLLKEIKKLTGTKYLAIEYGIESTLNKTLDYINRGHNFGKAIEAVNLNKELGITTGAHFILGLPGESKDEMMEHANIINKLPIDIIKLHQMQIIKGTRADEMYAVNPNEFGIFDLDSYVIFVSEFLRRLKKSFIIERFTSETPRETLIAPDWGGIKNFEVVHKIRNYMNENNFKQGDLCK